MNAKQIEKLEHAGGRRFSTLELAELVARVPEVHVAAVELLRDVPAVGLSFEIGEEQDPSGLGVSMQWMSLDHVISEAIEAYPGILATRRGYVPIGNCNMGSGDPYFLRATDGAVVRIPHEAASGGQELDEGQVEVIAASLDEFVERAVVEKTPMYLPVS